MICWPGLCLFILCSLTHNFRTHIRLTWPAITVLLLFVCCWLASQSLSPGSWNLWTYSRNSIPIQHSLCLSSPLLCVCWMEGMLLLREYARRTQHNDRLISSYIYFVVIAGHYDIESLTARICPKVFAIQFQVI